MTDTSAAGNLPVLEHPGAACEAVLKPGERGVQILSYIRRPAGSAIEAQHDEWSGPIDADLAARLRAALDGWSAQLRAATGLRVIGLKDFDTAVSGRAAIPDPTPEILDLVSRSVPVDLWRSHTIDASVCFQIVDRRVRVRSRINEPAVLDKNPVLRKGIARIYGDWLRRVLPCFRGIGDVDMDLRVPPPASSHEAMRRMAVRAAARNAGSPREES